jgi:hypothetical protein
MYCRQHREKKGSEREERKVVVLSVLAGVGMVTADVFSKKRDHEQGLNFTYTLSRKAMLVGLPLEISCGP